MQIKCDLISKLNIHTLAVYLFFCFKTKNFILSQNLINTKSRKLEIKKCNRKKSQSEDNAEEEKGLSDLKG